MAPFLFGLKTENGDEEHRQTKPQEDDILSNTPGGSGQPGNTAADLGV